MRRLPAQSACLTQQDGAGREHRVRFEVSLTAAGRSQCRISSELLAVAARVLGGSRRSYGFVADRGTVSGE
jgi:hypothetical protein